MDHRARCSSNPQGDGFVTALHLMPAPQALENEHNRRNIRRERVYAGASCAGNSTAATVVAACCSNANDGCRLHHDPPPLYAALLRAIAG
jgi:hypothetical protein